MAIIGERHEVLQSARIGLGLPEYDVVNHLKSGLFLVKTNHRDIGSQLNIGRPLYSINDKATTTVVFYPYSELIALGDPSRILKNVYSFTNKRVESIEKYARELRYESATAKQIEESWLKLNIELYEGYRAKYGKHANHNIGYYVSFVVL